MSDRSAGNGHASHPGVLLVSPPATRTPVLVEERQAAPPAVAPCSQRLPRDVLVRLGALSRQVDRIRQGTTAHSEFSVRLEDVANGLNALIQSIYDETALHFAGRRA